MKTVDNLVSIAPFPKKTEFVSRYSPEQLKAYADALRYARGRLYPEKNDSVDWNNGAKPAYYICDCLSEYRLKGGNLGWHELCEFKDEISERIDFHFGIGEWIQSKYGIELEYPELYKYRIRWIDSMIEEFEESK